MSHQPVDVYEEMIIINVINSSSIESDFLFQHPDRRPESFYGKLPKKFPAHNNNTTTATDNASPE